MKIELRGVKYAAFASEETACFKATVYIDGRKAGTVGNDGHGACHTFDPWSIEGTLRAHAKTLPKRSFEGFGYEPDADTLIDDALSAYLSERDLKRLLKSRVLFTKDDGKVYQTRAVREAKVLDYWIKNPPSGAVTVLNTAPFDVALRLYTGTQA